MTLVKQCIRIATLTLAIAAGQQALAAGYLKLDGIKGESQRSAPTASHRFHHGGGGGAGKANFQDHPAARGGLDRDIIRRSSGTRQQTTTRLPKVGATQLHGVEPDEID
ncbi:hypothetical protein MWU49_12155 [Alcanivorax sp. S6407]|uniref:hypothetical protein n=1 Tax=Alcanivorax sp. S6407 TaxID=2926424 RepID=UPI001FF20490|nr:hypothetical protein [Alcanivorax sp. S6407]MCK0154461.1 hypothetical protein [Alcanivorax sp. S6407]